MSAAKKAAKFSLYLFSVLVLLFVGAGIYFYMNVGSIAKQMTENVASNALGVPVTVDEMDISLETKTIVATNIKIANPDGYKKDHAIKIDRVTVIGESFSKSLLTFGRINVDGTSVNLEVSERSTNLGDIKKNIDVTQAKAKAQKTPETDGKENIKVIVREFVMSKGTLSPSVTLINRELNPISIPKVQLQGIGERENGVLAKEAVAQIMEQVIKQFNKSANQAGFLEGLSLEALNEIGVSTVDVFKKNLKESFDKDVDKFKKGVDQLKGMFSE